MKTLLILAASAALAACAAAPEHPNCGAAYPMELPMPTLIHSRLAPITGEETVHRQRRTIKAGLTCNLDAQADDSITWACFGVDLQTQQRIEATPEQARALIDALHLADVPEDRTDGGAIHYSLQSIQCVENEGCSAMIEPPCLP